MSKKKYVSFSDRWLLDERFKGWLKEVEKDEHAARCSYCCKTFDIGNMGESALTSHMKGKKHCEKAPSSGSVQSFFNQPAAGTSSASATNSQAGVTKNAGSVTSMIISTSTVHAEIGWALKVVMSKFSKSSCDDIAELFTVMFPDSSIAKSFSCAKTKCRYMITFGLAPYFRQLLQNDLKISPYHVISYDECFNRVLHFGQMDFLVRFWNVSKKIVETRYLTSEFLQGAKAEQLVDKYNNAVDTIDQSKLLQISSDGPSVNLKFLKIVNEQREEGNHLALIDIGTCGLHTVHGSLRNGIVSSGWKIDSVLRWMWNLLCFDPIYMASEQESAVKAFGLLSEKLLTLKRSHCFVVHFKIQNDGSGYRINGKNEFPSLPDLIKYYQTHPTHLVRYDGSYVEMIEPVVCEEIYNLGLTKERWYFGVMSKRETNVLLEQRGELGSYLVRESLSVPGNFVLSVRYEDRVLHFLIDNKDGRYSVGEGDCDFPSIHQLLAYYREMPLHIAGAGTLLLKEPLCDTAERKKKMNQIENIKTEFKYLQQEDRANMDTKFEGLRPENKEKNRYKNILPFDRNRVVLQDYSPGEPGSDYINASYICDNGNDVLFIASQGCVQGTINDFWCMVNQENCRLILMVINQGEITKGKCVQYWPEHGGLLKAGDLIVKNTSETLSHDYIVRELEISEKGEHSTWKTTVFLYQFIRWPNHGVPKDPGPLLELLQLTEAIQKNFGNVGPPIVHCSAGIGRTGTVVVIRLLMHLYCIKGYIEEGDILHTVQKVRLQRSGMVQTEVQYQFVYNAISYLMEIDGKKLDASSEQINTYCNLNGSRFITMKGNEYDYEPSLPQQPPKPSVKVMSMRERRSVKPKRPPKPKR